MLIWPEKDPDEVADYEIDWTEQLSGDTITASTWIVPTGITKDSDSNTTTSTTIWLSGGTTGTTYRLQNRVTTAGGRTFENTVGIAVADSTGRPVSVEQMREELGLPYGVDTVLIAAKLDAAQAHLESLLGYALADEFPDAVPADLIGAIKMLAANAYENREASLVGLAAIETPFGVWDIVANRRNYSWADA